MQYGDLDRSRVLARVVKSAKETSVVKAVRFQKMCSPREINYPLSFGVVLLIFGWILGVVFRAKVLGLLLDLAGAALTLIPLAWYYGTGYYSYLRVHGEVA